MTALPELDSTTHTIPCGCKPMHVCCRTSILHKYLYQVPCEIFEKVKCRLEIHQEKTCNSTLVSVKDNKRQASPHRLLPELGTKSRAARRSCFRRWEVTSRCSNHRSNISATTLSRPPSAQRSQSLPPQPGWHTQRPSPVRLG